MPYRVIQHKSAYLPVNANTDDACRTHTFTGCILDGSDCKIIGETKVNVYPDSVTLVNIRVSWPVVSGNGE